MMATGQNPSISVGKAAANPTPVTTYGNKFVKRTYQAFGKEATAGAGVDFKTDSFGLTGAFYVDKVSLWKLGLNGVGLHANLKQGNLTDLGVDDITAKDYGTGASLPGVTFKVPLGHAKQCTTTTVAVVVNAASTDSTTVESYVCNLTCWVQV